MPATLPRMATQQRVIHRKYVSDQPVNGDRGTSSAFCEHLNVLCLALPTGGTLRRGDIACRGL